MFEFPCIISLYYTKNERDATLAVLFISAADNRPWTSLLDIYHPDPWQPPVAVNTVLSAPDDGRRRRTKHVEWSCSD